MSNNPFHWQGEPSIFVKDKTFNGINARNSTESSRRVEETGAAHVITFKKERKSRAFTQVPTPALKPKKGGITLPKSSPFPEPQLMKRRNA